MEAQIEGDRWVDKWTREGGSEIGRREEGKDGGIAVRGELDVAV